MEAARGEFSGAKPCLSAVRILRATEAASGLWRPRVSASGTQTIVKSEDCRILVLSVVARAVGTAIGVAAVYLV